MKWILAILLLVLLVACGEFHEVTFRVESPDDSVSLTTVSWRNDNNLHWPLGPVALPFDAVEHLRHVEVSMTADTSLDIAGTITATILLDGAPIETGSVTASGSPASITISAYIPD